MNDNEKYIVEALREGKESAFKYLYTNHYAVLCHVAATYVGDDCVAEGIVSDVMFHLWEIHSSLDINTSLRSFLIIAVKNRAIDYIKSKPYRVENAFSSLGEDTDFVYSSVTSPDEYPLGLLLEKELEQKIITAIKNIPADSKRVFIMSRFKNMKLDDIAKELGISTNTVRYHIKKSLRFLREQLEDYLIDSSVIVFILKFFENFTTY